MSVPESAYGAALAYRQAVEDAGNFIDQQMRQYGWMSPGANGQYSVLNAQNAFDPERVIQFDQSGAPIVDTAGIAAATSGGQYGTTGLFAQAAQRGAAEAADVMLGQRQRGFGRGSGLVRGTQEVSQYGAQQQMGGLSQQFLQNLINRYSGLAKQYQGARVAQTTGATTGAGRLAGMTSLYNL